ASLQQRISLQREQIQIIPPQADDVFENVQKNIKPAQVFAHSSVACNINLVNQSRNRPALVLFLGTEPFLRHYLRVPPNAGGELLRLAPMHVQIRSGSNWVRNSTVIFVSQRRSGDR
ncbi:MAG: hypothetical protein MJA29_01425, partial [Candidatus Omnitrophica bacterium]|nr:hypothetical protein [Candidatus Omnitrophota bacterium]